MNATSSSCFLNGTPMTTLIGRAAEVAAVTAAISCWSETGHADWGQAGSEKRGWPSRRQAAIQTQGAIEVWFLSLTSLRYPALLLNTIAAALGVAEPADGSLEAAMVEQLADRKLVLVLDGFDHLLDVTPAIERLLSAAPGLQVLITSRSPLRLTNEQIIEILL